MSRPGPGRRRSLWGEGARLGAPLPAGQPLPPRPDAASRPVDVTAACSVQAPDAVVSQATPAGLWQGRSLPGCPAVSRSDCGQDTLSAPVNPQCPPGAPRLHSRPSGSRTACPFPVICHPCPTRHTLPLFQVLLERCGLGHARPCLGGAALVTAGSSVSAGSAWPPSRAAAPQFPRPERMAWGLGRGAV